MIQYYTGLLADTDRINAFQQSITNAVRPDDVVVELGSGVGTYTIFAARAGARRVFGIESSSVIEFARQVAEKNASSIEFIQGDALNLDIPEPASLLIYEDFSTGLLNGSTRALLEHARSRWMAKDFRVLPERASLIVAPINSASARNLAFPLELEKHINGIDLQVLQQASENTVIDLRSPTDIRVLAEPQLVLDQALDELLPDSWSSAGVLKIEDDSDFDGFCMWLDFQLDSKNSYTNHPAGSGVYGQLFFPVSRRWCLKKGDNLAFTIRYKAVASEDMWAWSAEVHRNGKVIEKKFAGNTFASSILTPANIHRYDPSRVIKLSRRANLEALVLSLVDEKRTFFQICQEVRRQLGESASAEAMQILSRNIESGSLL